MQKMLTKIFLVIGYSIFGALAGSILGIGLLTLQRSDVFVSWKLLDNPSKFTHIDPIFSNESDIIATSQEGKTYLWDCDSKTGCSWVKTEEIFEVINDDWNKKGPSCQSPEISSPKNPPDGVVECVFTSWSAGEGYDVDYYALLNDGKVWHWGKSHDAFGDIYFISFWVKIGAVLGALIEIIFIYRKEKQKIS